MRKVEPRKDAWNKHREHAGIGSRFLHRKRPTRSQAGWASSVRLRLNSPERSRTLLETDPAEVLGLSRVAAMPLGAAALGDGRRVGPLPPLVAFPVLGLLLHGADNLLAPVFDRAGERSDIMVLVSRKTQHERWNRVRPAGQANGGPAQ